MTKLMWLGIMVRIASVFSLVLFFITYYRDMFDTALLCLGISVFAWMLGSFVFAIYEHMLLRAISKGVVSLTPPTEDDVKFEPIDPEHLPPFRDSEKLSSHPLFVQKDENNEQ